MPPKKTATAVPPPLAAPQHDTDEALRFRILTRAAEINKEILARLTQVADDLDAGSHLTALGGLDGIEHELAIIRSILLLLP